MARFVAVLFSVAAVVTGAHMALPQDYPNRPIRIVTAGVGGSSDYAARLIAQGISGSLGQPVIVENRPSGIIPGDTVAKASPDGYTLLFAGATLWVGPLMQNTPYDPVRDFSPITLVTSSPNVLVVNPSLPVKSVKELIALAKARPGELNYSTGGTGGPSHLAGELFKHMAGVNLVRIPYNSNAKQMADLISGQVEVTIDGFALMPHIKSGRLKGLAVTSLQPSALFPGLPTVAASGVPGYEAVTLNGIFAPARTPAAVINRLNQEIVRLLHDAKVKGQFLNTGGETVGSSPDELANGIKAEIARWGKVIRDAGIRLN